MMRASLALTFARRAGVVASQRSAPHCPVVFKAMSAKVRAFSSKAYAVDAPDGETDGHLKEEQDEANYIIEETARIESTPEFADIKKAFAVDAPDGETDGHIQEEMEEIAHIIDDAHDKDKVLASQKFEKEEKIEAEKHPEHDW